MTASNRCANCIAVQTVDFAVITADDQREVGASGAPLPGPGATKAKADKGVFLLQCIAISGPYCANIPLAVHSGALLLMP